jgi:hypothetical protein
LWAGWPQVDAPAGCAGVVLALNLMLGDDRWFFLTFAVVAAVAVQVPAFSWSSRR